MPRFYFHIVDGEDVTRDEEGLDLPDREAARLAALDGARDIMAAEIHQGAIDLRMRIEVEDEEGQALLSVPFADAVQVSAPR